MIGYLSLLLCVINYCLIAALVARWSREQGVTDDSDGHWVLGVLWPVTLADYAGDGLLWLIFLPGKLSWLLICFLVHGMRLFTLSAAATKQF